MLKLNLTNETGETNGTWSWGDETLLQFEFGGEYGTYYETFRDKYAPEGIMAVLADGFRLAGLAGSGQRG